jgi:CarD family transcriptional regulator
MSSVKKTDKSRKAKATIARAALKSRTTAAKTSKSSASKSSAAKTRPERAKTRTAPVAARTATKAKTARKPASTSSTSTSSKSSAAAKLRAAQARAKKQTAAAKAARPTAKSSATKSAASSATKSAAAARKTKTNQTATAAKLKRSTNVSRGKSRAGRNTPVEAKLQKAVTTVQQPAAPQTKPEAVVKKVDSERRAQVAAVLALRSLRKPAPAAEPVVRPEASKVSVTQKAPKKAAEAAPAPIAAPVAPKAVAPSAPEPAVDVKAAAPIIEKPKPAKPAAPVKHGFKPLEFVVYPAHGVGQILAVEEQEVAGFKLELFVISFSKDKMILKVPTPKSIAVGMRKLAGPEVVKHALNTLTGRARIKRTMWSRRAQEYEAKINSGDLVAIAEVVRDLYRSDAQPEQSYSERQLYEAALDRVAREIAAVQKLTETESLKVIESQLQKSPRRSKADEAEADAEAEAGEDGGIDEAA